MISVRIRLICHVTDMMKNKYLQLFSVFYSWIVNLQFSLQILPQLFPSTHIFTSFLCTAI